MLRLEDIGPGGEYGTLEGLGKLRAVLEGLEQSGTAFHMAVIPRSIQVDDDGQWTNRGIDDPNPDAYMQAFIRLLQNAEQGGAVLGMHGYTHQYGEEVREDQNHISGIAREFKVPGAEETFEPSYAADRIERSLQAFDQIGLTPAFWESPHYKDTRDQEEVFRSYMGILYEPDLYSLRSFKDLNMKEQENTYGSTTLGSVYVPAPLKYIHDDASVDRVVDRASGYNGLGAVYFHPFLEFKALEPVLDEAGKPVVRDGLPEYRYPQGSESLLQKLVGGLEQEGYRFISLHEAVPFSPANRLTIEASPAGLAPMFGDVTGDGQADAVIQQEDRIALIEGAFGWPRNQAQQPMQTWLARSASPDEALLLADADMDGRAELIVYNKASGLLQYSTWNGTNGSALAAIGELPAQLESLQPLKTEQPGTASVEWLARQQGKLIDISFADGTLSWEETAIALPDEDQLQLGQLDGEGSEELLVIPPTGNGSIMTYSRQANGVWVAAGTIPIPDDMKKSQLLVQDTNGDGRDDLIAYLPSSGVWQVTLNQGNGAWTPMDNPYGPWASGVNRIALTADFDGNGKGDIASYDPKEQVVDLSLSFQP